MVCVTGRLEFFAFIQFHVSLGDALKSTCSVRAPENGTDDSQLGFGMLDSLTEVRYAPLMSDKKCFSEDMMPIFFHFTKSVFTSSCSSNNVRRSRGCAHDKGLVQQILFKRRTSAKPTKLSREYQPLVVYVACRLNPTRRNSTPISHVLNVTTVVG